MSRVCIPVWARSYARSAIFRGKKLRELQGMRLHVLRHSFPSIGAGASPGLSIVGKLLGHSQPATTNRYSHLDANPLRHAANAISTSIAAALAGAKGAKLGNPCV